MAYKKQWNKRRPPAAKPDLNDGEEITGVVENIVYRSDDTNYTVCRIKVTGQKDLLTVVGTCPAIWVGEID